MWYCVTNPLPHLDLSNMIEANSQSRRNSSAFDRRSVLISENLEMSVDAEDRQRRSSIGPANSGHGRKSAGQTRLHVKKYEKILKEITVVADQSATVALGHKYGMKVIFVLLYFLFAGTFYSTHSTACRSRSDINTGASCTTRNWNGLESIYFAIVTMFTVGYNNYFPSNDVSKAVSLFFLVFGIYVVACMSEV